MDLHFFALQVWMGALLPVHVDEDLRDLQVMYIGNFYQCEDCHELLCTVAV